MKEQILAVQRMQDYIEKNNAEEISLSDLARASLFSPANSILLPICVMLGVTSVCSALSACFFRWE